MHMTLTSASQVFAVFVSVTSFALAISMIDILWYGAKLFKWKEQIPPLYVAPNRLLHAKLFASIV
jgi:hypothetical protein